MTVATSAQVLADAMRYITLGMGAILVAIAGFGIIASLRLDARELVLAGTTILWLGRMLMVIFFCVIIIERLGKPMGLYTPAIFVIFLLLVVGNFLSRDRVAAFIAGEHVERH